MYRKIIFCVTALLACCSLLRAQAPAATGDSIMVTIFLKHQQDKNLKKIQEIEEQNKFWDMFPPKQTRVVSWYVMMGVGQVVTLRLAPKDLRTLNMAVENGAWGAFTTSFYPTYDYVPVWKETMSKRPKTP